MSSNNTFQELTEDKFVIGKPMKKEAIAFKMIARIGKLSSLTILFSLVLNTFLLVNYFLVGIIVLILDTTPIKFFLAINAFYVFIVIIFSFLKRALQDSVERTKVNRVKVWSVFSFVFSIPAVIVYGVFSIISVSILKDVIDLAITKMNNWSSQTKGQFHYMPDGFFELSFLSVFNYALIITLLVLTFFLLYYSINVFIYSIRVFFNAFILVEYKYLYDEIIELKTVEDNKWNREIIEDIVSYYFKKKDKKVVKEKVNEIFASGEVRAYSRFKEISGIYVLGKDGDFSNMFVKNFQRNIEAMDHLINDYAFLALMHKDEAVLYIPHNDERMASSARKSGFNANKANSTHYMFTVSKPAITLNESQ